MTNYLITLIIKNQGGNTVDNLEKWVKVTMFINLLNKYRVDNTGDGLEKLMKVTLIHTFHLNYPKGMKLFELIYLAGELYTVEAGGKILDACKYPLMLLSISQSKKNRNLRKID